MNLIELQRVLRQLRLGGIAEVLETRLHQAQTESMAPIDLVSCLVSDELDRRSVRLLERRRKQARFRDPQTTLDNFDFTFNKKMNRSLVFDLATAAFISRHEDALFLGPPGTGKSHLAQAIELPYCDTDKELFELTVAATHSREVDWLKTIMGEDRASRHLWRQQRAMVVDGFLGGKTLPVQEAWPDGKLETTRAWVSCVSARSQSIMACASHWWRLYCDASDPVEAYAAWILFLRSADRRAWVLARRDINAPSSPDDFLGRKMIHCRLNENNLQHAMRKRDEQFDQTFLHRKIERGIGPWT